MNKAVAKLSLHKKLGQKGRPKRLIAENSDDDEIRELKQLHNKIKDLVLTIRRTQRSRERRRIDRAVRRQEKLQRRKQQIEQELYEENAKMIKQEYDEDAYLECKSENRGFQSWENMSPGFVPIPYCEIKKEPGYEHVNDPYVPINNPRDNDANCTWTCQQSGTSKSGLPILKIKRVLKYPQQPVFVHKPPRPRQNLDLLYPPLVLSESSSDEKNKRSSWKLKQRHTLI